MRHHHDIEAAARKVGEPGVEILPDNVQPAADGLGYGGGVDLDTDTAHIAALAQQSQKFAVAAAEVEHAGARANPAQDAGQVLAHQTVTRCI